MSPEGSDTAAAVLGRDQAWEEVVEGLRSRPRRLPPKLFYDARGAALFERIMRLDAYYPTRTELGILRRFAPEMASLAGPGVLLLEPGSGSGEKTMLLLGALDAPVAYVPVDISQRQLEAFAERVRAEHGVVEVLPVAADYTRAFPLPRPRREPRRTVVFFPGSTVGNFEPDAAGVFLHHLREEAGPGSALLLGVDLEKDPAVLELAYNDPEGVTAAFNRNILRHVNRLFEGDFDPDGFEHHAPWVAEHHRIEMRLVARHAQVAVIPHPSGDQPPEEVPFERGEHIVTEHSYKFTPERIESLTRDAGWRGVRTWTDERRWFGVQFLERTD